MQPIRIQVTHNWPTDLACSPTMVRPGLWYLSLPSDEGLDAHERVWAARGYTGIIRVQRPHIRYLAYLAGEHRPTEPDLHSACHPIALPCPASFGLMRASWALDRLSAWVAAASVRLDAALLARAIRRAAR